MNIFTVTGRCSNSLRTMEGDSSAASGGYDVSKWSLKK
jgi:hypothetical protein